MSASLEGRVFCYTHMNQEMLGHCPVEVSEANGPMQH